MGLARPGRGASPARARPPAGALELRSGGPEPQQRHRHAGAQLARRAGSGGRRSPAAEPGAGQCRARPAASRLGLASSLPARTALVLDPSARPATGRPCLRAGTGRSRPARRLAARGRPGRARRRSPAAATGRPRGPLRLVAAALAPVPLRRRPRPRRAPRDTRSRARRMGSDRARCDPCRAGACGSDRVARLASPGEGCRRSARAARVRGFQGRPEPPQGTRRNPRPGARGHARDARAAGLALSREQGLSPAATRPPRAAAASGQSRHPEPRCAGAECAAAGVGARRLRHSRRHRAGAPGAGGDALRARAGAGDQVGARHRARGRHRPLDERDFRPRLGDPGAQRDRHRAPQQPPRDRAPARDSRLQGL